MLECAAFVLAIVVPVSVQAGMFDTLLSSTSAEVEAIDDAPVSDSALDAPVLVAAVNPVPRSARGGDDVVAVDGVLVSTGPIGKDAMLAARSDNGGEISVYTVREGDSLSQIAAMFDVTSNTILWANDLPKASAIKPGDTLVILPVAGVRHVVKKGDTLASIAKKYEGDATEIQSYNQLASASDITVGATLVIPGGEMHTAAVVTKTKGTTPTKSSASTNNTAAGTGSFVNPAPGTKKSQGLHGYNAVDLAGGVGTGVRSAAAGEVIVAKSSGWNGGYGSYIVIKHKNGTQTLYAHLSRVDVSVGDAVAQAEAIGAVGMTGKSTGPHLHFEVRGGKNPF